MLGAARRLRRLLLLGNHALGTGGRLRSRRLRRLLLIDDDPAGAGRFGIGLLQFDAAVSELVGSRRRLSCWGVGLLESAVRRLGVVGLNEARGVAQED